MTYLKRVAVLICIAAAALIIPGCWLSDSGNPNDFSSGRFVDPITYFLLQGWVVTPSNQYSVGLLNFQNPLSEAITFRLNLDSTNWNRFDFSNSIVHAVDNGDGTGTLTGDMDPLEEFSVSLFIKEPFVTSMQVSTIPIDIFRMGEADKGAPINSDSLRVTGYLRPFLNLDYTLMTANDIGGLTLENNMLNWTWGYSNVARLPSPANHPAVLARDHVQITFGSVAFGSDGGYESAGRGVIPFACGPIDMGAGLVLCPTFPAAVSPGPFIYVSMVMDGTVPLADPVNHYQYGLVFDADGLSSNNFVADPAFPNDFFQGTDLWYFINYDPVNGWSLSTVDASGAGNPQAFFSDAKAVIRGNTIFWIVPIDEFPGSPTEFLFRLTAFKNNGPFNMLDQYEVDYEPDIDEPLLAVSAPVR